MRLDLLHLLRNLRRSPASAGAAIVTLSLTLAAGASIFAIVDAVLLTPPPFTNPDALVSVGEIPIDDATVAPRTVTYATFEAWRERAGSMAAIEALDGTNFTLTELGAAERVSASNVTPGFLTLLGVTLTLAARSIRSSSFEPNKRRAIASPLVRSGLTEPIDRGGPAAAWALGGGTPDTTRHARAPGRALRTESPARHTPSSPQKRRQKQEVGEAAVGEVQNACDHRAS